MFTRPDRAVDRVFLHCSASDHPNHDNISTMRKWHIEDRGWSDVGYHFFIRKDGTLEEGRPLDRTPAAQGGNNRGTIAICLHGLARENFAEAQYTPLIELCGEITASYQGMVTSHSHCEVSSKACPVFPYEAVLGLDDHGEMVFAKSSRPDGMNPPSESLPTDRTPPRPILRISDRSSDVEILQRLLIDAGNSVTADGIFGQGTAAAVRVFQVSNGLVADAIVGPATWKALQA